MVIHYNFMPWWVRALEACGGSHCTCECVWVSVWVSHSMRYLFTYLHDHWKLMTETRNASLTQYYLEKWWIFDSGHTTWVHVTTADCYSYIPGPCLLLACMWAAAVMCAFCAEPEVEMPIWTKFFSPQRHQHFIALILLENYYYGNYYFVLVLDISMYCFDENMDTGRYWHIIIVDLWDYHSNQ